MLSFAPKPQQIFIADFEDVKKSLIADAVMESARSNKDHMQIAKEKLSKFRLHVSKIAQEKNVIIVNKDMVLGSDQKDITADLKLLINDLD